MASNFDVKTSRSVGTTATRIGSYTVASSTKTTVIGLTLANVTNTAITATAFHSSHTNNGSNTHLIKNAPIPAGSSLVVVGGDQKVVLANVHGVFVASNTASSLDAVMSILEVT